jgi:hypothetical protein
MRRSALRRSSELVAGLTLAASLLPLGAAPAHAAAVVNEAQLRAAFANPAETAIDLTANVDLADCAAGQLLRPDGAAALAVNGGGHTIRQTCTGHRVMANGNGALTLDNITITGGSLDAGVLGGAGGGILSAGALTIEDSTTSTATSPAAQPRAVDRRPR